MRKGIFVVGNARTGTTILCDILSSSPDIFMLGEPNFHWSWNEKNFVHRYNLQHRRDGNEPLRSTYLPLAWLGLTPPEILERLSESFKFVGSKIAFPPFQDTPPVANIEAVLEFHAAHFLASTYFHTVRDPVSVCVSSRKIFQVSFNDALTGWLETMIFHMAAIKIFPNSYVLPQALIDNQLLKRLSQILDTRFDADTSWIEDAGPKLPGTSKWQSEKAAVESEVRLANESPFGAGDLLSEATDIYTNFSERVAHDTLRVDLSPTDQRALIARTRRLLSCLPPWQKQVSANLLQHVDDLSHESWMKRGVCVVAPSLGSKDAAPISIIEESPSAGHKHLIQHVKYLTTNEAVVFTVEVESRGTLGCTLQIQHSSLATCNFDLDRCEVRFGSALDPMIFLQGNCSRLTDGWIKCQLVVKLAGPSTDTLAAIYLSDATGELDYPGNPDNGIWVRAPRFERLLMKLASTSATGFNHDAP